MQAAKVPAINKEYEPQLDALLSDAQRRRLCQITLQALGGDALSRTDVADALNLTAEQQEQVKAVRKKHADAFTEILKKRAVTVEESRVNAVAQLDVERHRHPDLMVVLTPEQAAKLKELQGPPFDTSCFNVHDIYGPNFPPRNDLNR